MLTGFCVSTCNKALHPHHYTDFVFRDEGAASCNGESLRQPLPDVLTFVDLCCSATPVILLPAKGNFNATDSLWGLFHQVMLKSSQVPVTILYILNVSSCFMRARTGLDGIMNYLQLWNVVTCYGWVQRNLKQ